jgi:hypothetical protein
MVVDINVSSFGVMRLKDLKFVICDLKFENTLNLEL